MKKIITWLVVLILLGSVAAGLGFWYYQAAGRNSPTFKTGPVERGTLTATISATGTVEPIDPVDVGAQVVGIIKSFGPDPADSTGTKTIDFGTQVEKDTILARIDDAMFLSAELQAKADLAAADANVKLAQANLEAMRWKLVQNQRDWERAQSLLPSKSISPVDYDIAQNAFETAKAAVPGGEASVAQAKAAVEKAKANLANAETNLGYTIIKSPVKGVIIARRVNIGQTVVSSLNAPSLFLIAKDLKKMQVWASVNEADIGQIRAGQPVHFTVDAFPGKNFEGEVAQIRLNAVVTQNVVTYTVVVNTDNSGGKLLPYMTANLQFQVDEHKDILKVPNAALRWKPDAKEVTPDARDAFLQAQMKQANVAAGPKGPQASAEKERRGHGVVWIQDGAFVRPIKVTVGLSDDTSTEVSGSEVQENMQVILRENHADTADAGSGTTNPFAPKLFGGKKP